MIYWDRITLKNRAKTLLQKTYWISLLVMLVVSIVGGSLNYIWRVPDTEAFGFGVSSWSWNMQHNWQNFTHSWESFRGAIPWAVISMLFGFGLVASVIGWAYKAFVANMAELGKDRYFTVCRYGSTRFEEIIFGFKKGQYLNNVKTLFLRDLYTFLWSLLFWVPGIIKHYSYWMMPYILAENPGISTERAFEISKQATMGEKGEMFVLDLSFIGWYLLATITCGIGFLFLSPYIEATKAELYGALRFKAVHTGICTRDEIGAEL